MACTRERGGFPVAFYLGARTCGRVGRAAWRAAAWVDGFALLVSLRRAESSAAVALQRAAGLAEDGIVGPKTKAALTTGSGLANDSTVAGGHPDARSGKVITWWLDDESLPGYLKLASVLAELAAAFEAWSAPCGVTFTREVDATRATLHIDFDDRSEVNEFVFDGPGGALAEATPQSITFDASERWVLAEDGAQPTRKWVSWEETTFCLLPVAMHEIGHVLGLTHSNEPRDVMSPFYMSDRVRLSDNDLARAKGLLGATPSPSSAPPKTTTAPPPPAGVADARVAEPPEIAVKPQPSSGCCELM